MSRPLRTKCPGAWHHIMNRGRRRERVFLDSSDYQSFIDLLANVSDMFKAQVAAFALMPNHSIWTRPATGICGSWRRMTAKGWSRRS